MCGKAGEWNQYESVREKGSYGNLSLRKTRMRKAGDCASSRDDAKELKGGNHFLESRSGEEGEQIIDGENGGKRKPGGREDLKVLREEVFCRVHNKKEYRDRVVSSTKRRRERRTAEGNPLSENGAVTWPTKKNHQKGTCKKLPRGGRHCWDRHKANSGSQRF